MEIHEEEIRVQAHKTDYVVLNGENFFEWFKNLCQFTARRGLLIDPKWGFLYLIFGDAEFQTKFGKQRPAVLEEVQAPGATAGTGTIAIYNLNVRKYRDQCEFERNDFPAFMAATTGRLFDRYLDELTGHCNRTVLEIVAAMRAGRETMDATRRDKLKEELNRRPDKVDAHGLEVHQEQFNGIVRALAKAEQPVSSADQYAAIKKGFEDFPGLMYLVRQFELAKPEMGDQKVSDLITFMLLGNRLETASVSVGYVMGTAGVANSVVSTSRESQLEARIRGLEGGQAHAATVVGGGAAWEERLEARIRALEGGRANAATQHVLYCWKHGYCKHNGADCFDKAITKIQRQARKPSDVQGGSKKDYREQG